MAVNNKPTLQDPIETWIAPSIGWEWRVLSKESEYKWYCAVQKTHANAKGNPLTTTLLTWDTWEFGIVRPSTIMLMGGFPEVLADKLL